MDRRAVIVRELEILQKNELQLKNVFKARAYGKVLAQIKNLEPSKPIRNMEDLEAEGFTGIGAAIRAKLEEIFASGHLEAADALRENSHVGAKDAFMKVYGIGPVKANELVTKNNLRTIADLRAASAANPKLLNDKQKVGLKYAEDIVQRIPRAEMELHAAKVGSLVRATSPLFEMEIVGSFRRGAKDSGDIDVLLRVPDDSDPEQLFSDLCNRLTAEGYVVDVLAKGDKKFMGFCRLPGAPARRLDILLTPASEYAYAILYFTGSDKFNVGMRRHALERGYTLNEHGMKPIRQGVPPVPEMANELAIFRFLDYPFRKPDDR